MAAYAEYYPEVQTSDLQQQPFSVSNSVIAQQPQFVQSSVPVQYYTPQQLQTLGGFPSSSIIRVQQQELPQQVIYAEPQQQVFEVQQPVQYINPSLQRGEWVPAQSQPQAGAVAFSGAPLWKEPIMTNLGDIVLISEFPNAVRHARCALAPWLQQINQERAKRGVHQVGIREQIVKQLQQSLCFIHLEGKFKHLVIFVVPGATIRHIGVKSISTSYEHLYSQANNGLNDIMVFVVGPITDKKYLQRGSLRVGNPDPNHMGLFDPIVLDSGMFQGDPVSLRKMKQGYLFSFYQFLNENQFNQLTKIFHGFTNTCTRFERKSSSISMWPKNTGK